MAASTQGQQLQQQPCAPPRAQPPRDPLAAPRGPRQPADAENPHRHCHQRAHHHQQLPSSGHRCRSAHRARAGAARRTRAPQFQQTRRRAVIWRAQGRPHGRRSRGPDHHYGTRISAARARETRRRVTCVRAEDDAFTHRQDVVHRHIRAPHDTPPPSLDVHVPPARRDARAARDAARRRAPRPVLEPACAATVNRLPPAPHPVAGRPAHVAHAHGAKDVPPAHAVPPPRRLVRGLVLCRSHRGETRDRQPTHRFVHVSCLRVVVSAGEVTLS
jgi:hypothetical protein